MNTIDTTATDLSCHCCGNAVPVPEFPNTPEGQQDRADYWTAVDNHEGRSPEMCDECEEFYGTEHKPIKVDATEPEIIQKFRGIMENGMGAIKFEGRKVKVDSFSASAVVKVYEALNEKNRQTFIEKTKGNPVRMCAVAFKLIK